MKLSGLGFGILLLAGSIVATAQERDLDTTFQALKQAVEKKDADAVKKLAAETHEAASADTSDHAKEVDLYTEYALYATAVQAPPATTVDLLAALEEQNPKSKYFDLGYARYFAALLQTGAAAKVPAVAEKALANVPENTDVLKVLTETAMAKNQTDKGLGLGKRLVAAAGKRQKPEGMPEAEFEKDRNTNLGYGNLIVGVVQTAKTQYFEANKSLRAALPLIQGNQAWLSTCLFQLGIVNYQLGKQVLNKAQVREGAKFSEQAAAIKGPNQDQAWKNAQVMKAEADKMR
jgi:hypothetical protein